MRYVVLLIGRLSAKKFIGKTFLIVSANTLDCALKSYSLFDCQVNAKRSLDLFFVAIAVLSLLNHGHPQRIWRGNIAIYLINWLYREKYLSRELMMNYEQKVFTDIL